jgi:hypothetical protein
MSDPPRAEPAERIAAAVGRLRAREVAVDVVIDDATVRYTVTRPVYTVEVYVDPAHLISLEFDLLGQPDGSVRLHYFVDTGRYDISQPAHARFASATATDIVLFLDALADGRLLTKVDRRRAAMIIPTGDGPRIVKRGRLWTSTGRVARDGTAATRGGFRVLAY